jgi:diguanylate cyclase (GGDEF)-like protein
MNYLRDALPIFTDLLNNGILLFGLGFIYAATNYNQETTKAFKKIILGLVIGIITYFIMVNTLKIAEGLIFDTRSVILSVTGLFFGPLTTLIAIIIPLIYRISIGGPGVYSGVLTILTTSAFGLTWHYIRPLFPPMKRYIEFLIFGLIVHIITLTCFLAIPLPTRLDVLRATTLPFLTLFPILTMLLAVIVDNQKDRMVSHQRIKDQQILLQASIDSTKAMEVFAVDLNYQYLSFNEYHRISMKNYYGIEIKKGKSFLSYIENKKMRDRLQASIDEASLGHSHTEINLIETSTDKYLEEQYSPIYDEHNRIVGVTVFSQDISERKKYEQSILYLSYRDPLTNLHNRRYYNEELNRLDQPKYYPLTIVTADINGLKIMNDAFGHDAGDLLLCTIADDLIKIFKNESRVARIGGDEFVILLPNTTKDKGLALVDQAKEKIEKNIIHGMSVSVSFGIATKDDEGIVKDIIKLAEDDMYTHKLFEISSHRNETIKTILNTLHEKNPREEKHSARVSKICKRIGSALNMKREEIRLLEAISNLHDIGKIAIDDAILNKPGKLDDREWELIKKHPEIGYRILSSSPEYSEIALDILSHHERYDGKGYPRAIQGEDIPIRARIISIADAYDAMVSERPYRKSLTHQEAIAEIKRNLGSQFDPTIGQLFIELYGSQEESI